MNKVGRGIHALAGYWFKLSRARIVLTNYLSAAIERTLDKDLQDVTRFTRDLVHPVNLVHPV
jgi:hypothetical protein